MYEKPQGTHYLKEVTNTYGFPTQTLTDSKTYKNKTSTSITISFYSINTTWIELLGDGATEPSDMRVRDLSGVDEVSPLNPFNASVDKFFFNCCNIQVCMIISSYEVIFSVAGTLAPWFKSYYCMKTGCPQAGHWQQ